VKNGDFTSAVVTQRGGPPPRRPSPSTSTICDAIPRRATSAATAAPSEWPTTIGFFSPSALQNACTWSPQCWSVHGPRRSV
jgi:hypothetical protein